MSIELHRRTNRLLLISPGPSEPSLLYPPTLLPNFFGLFDRLYRADFDTTPPVQAVMLNENPRVLTSFQTDDQEQNVWCSTSSTDAERESVRGDIPRLV